MKKNKIRIVGKIAYVYLDKGVITKIDVDDVKRISTLYWNFNGHYALNRLKRIWLAKYIIWAKKNKSDKICHVHLGSFTTKRKATIARMAAEKKYWGYSYEQKQS